MRIEAEVSLRRQGAWTFGASAISGLLILFVALQDRISNLTYVAIAGVVTLLSFLALSHDARPDPAKATKRRVRVNGSGLGLDGELVVPREAIRRTRILRHGPGGGCALVVETRGFLPVYLVEVGSPRIAQALIEELEQASNQATEFKALPPWSHRMRWLALALTTSPWILFNLLRHLPAFTILVVLALYAVLGMSILLPQKVTVGEDGVLFRWAGRRRFVPFGVLEGARMTPLGVELELANTESVEIRLTHNADGESQRRAAILEQIQKGLAQHRALRPAEDEALLARGTRGVEAWIAEVTTLGSNDLAGYRTMAMPRERLWSILENPAADPSARAGAAIALRVELADDERERLTHIARKSASPRLRVALEAVSEAVDAPRLRVALEEAEALEATADETRARTV